MAFKPRQLSAGILLYRETRETDDSLRVLLAHPGGPYFTNQDGSSKKDAGAWTIPKGLVEPAEESERAARREFEEEVGWRPAGELQPLGEIRLKSGKRVIAFALAYHAAEEELLAKFTPGRFTMEWPPHSGKFSEFPEVDRIEFFSLSTAREKINERQAPLLDRFVELRRTQAAQSLEHSSAN
jgi:predicted NUDIX family NTP pyrophosphohydrolase